jgi:uncharacterized membrane protein
MKIDRIISYILTITIIIALVTVIYLIINPSTGEKFTEFYILGPEGKAGDYPTNLTLGERGDLIISIVNHEETNTRYQLVVQLNSVIIKNETFDLKNEEKKEIPFTFQVNQSGNGQKLEFLLYKLPNTLNPYRQLDLLIDVT